MDKINEITVGDTYHTEVVMADGTKHNVVFYIGTRSGANNAMITGVLRDFVSAIRSIANGAIEAAEGFDVPGDYEPSEHGEARVTLWVKAPGIPVLLEDGMRFVQVNVFTEDSTAQTLIDMVNIHVNTMARIIDSGVVQIANAVIAKPKSELDKYFPRDESDKPVVSPPQAQRTDYAAIPPEVIDIGNYDYNQQTQYEKDYCGRTVAINVSRVSRDMEVKNDKSATYECLNVWGYYDGLPSDKHPMYSFRMFAPKPEQKYGDWQTFFKHIQTGELSDPGKAITGPMRFYYKLAQGSRNNEGKVYWNLRKVEFLGGVPASGEHSQKASSAPVDQSGLNRSEDEIPF